MKQVQLLQQYYTPTGQIIDTWEIARQVAIIGDDPVVRRVDGLLEVVCDHSRIREVPDQKKPS